MWDRAVEFVFNLFDKGDVLDNNVFKPVDYI